MSHKTYCTLNVKYFPFDTQTCDIQFISWTFSGLELNISYSKSFENAMYYKSENQVGSDATEMLFRNS